MYVLDIFLGHDLPATTLSFLESEGFLSKLALPFSFLWAAPTLVFWFRTHGLEANVKPRAHAAAAALGALARQQGVPLYSVGFCFGGRYAALVAAPSGGQPAAVQACVAAHPSFLSDAEAAAVSVPSLYCVVGSDQFTQAHATKAAAAQGAGGLPLDRQAKAIVYKWVGHGFAVRGGPSTTEARSVRAQQYAVCAWGGGGGSAPTAQGSPQLMLLTPPTAAPLFLQSQVRGRCHCLP